MLKVNNRNPRARDVICSELSIKTSEQRPWRHFGVFIVDLERISCIIVNSIVEQVNVSRVITKSNFFISVKLVQPIRREYDKISEATQQK